jgi:hypothetical protein
VSEPTTRSLLEEHAKRIERAMKESARGSDLEWRDKQSEQWGRISAFIEFQTQYNETDARWKKDHQRQDEDNFDELSAKIDAKVGAVSSSINKERQENSFSLKQIFLGGLAILSVVGGWVLSIWAIMGKTP